jgi:hypothetical protein
MRLVASHRWDAVQDDLLRPGAQGADHLFDWDAGLAPGFQVHSAMGIGETD